MATASLNQMPEIDWDNFQVNNENYDRIKQNALDLTRLTLDAKTLKGETLAWARQRLSADEVAQFEAADDWRFSAIGKYHYILNRNGELTDDTLEWLAPKVEDVLAIGAVNIEKELEKQAKQATKKVIDPKVRDAQQGYGLAVALEDMVLTKVYPKDHKSAYNVLGHSGASPAVLRNTVSVLAGFVDEFNDLADDEVLDYYGSREAWATSKENYTGLLTLAQNFSSNSKRRRKTRRQRTEKTTGAKGRAVKATSDVKFQREYAEYQLVSADPSQIIGAKSVLVFNTKTRRIGLYFAEDDSGLAIRGTTIHGFSKKSSQKTLRKPMEQLESFRGATMKRCEIVLRDYVKAKEVDLNGRINSHTVIMKVWK